MHEKLPLLPHDKPSRKRHAVSRSYRPLIWSILAFLALHSLFLAHKHKHRHGRSGLRWKTCPDDKAFQCAYLEAPMNVSQKPERRLLLKASCSTMTRTIQRLSLLRYASCLLPARRKTIEARF